MSKSSIQQKLIISVFVDSARQFQSFLYVKLTNRIIYTHLKQYQRYSAPRQGLCLDQLSESASPGLPSPTNCAPKSSFESTCPKTQGTKEDQLAPTRTDSVKLCFSLIQFSEGSNNSIFQTQLESFWPRLVAKTRAGSHDAIVYFCIRMHMFKLILP